MNEHLDNDVNDAIDKSMQSAGLRLSLLKPNTKLTVETRNSFYEMEVIDGPIVKLFGGTLRDGSTRYPQPVEAIIQGSSFGTALLRMDWLGVGMNMELIERHNPRLLVTTEIRRITVEDTEKHWSYTLR
jgi:hypothetical protein